MVDQARDDVADDDLPGLGGVLEPGGDADGVAGHEALSGVGRGRDHLARGDADPYLELDVVLRRRWSLSAVTPTDVQCGARRAQRVVLVRDRDAERGHDRVARVLLDRPAVPRDRAARRLK